MKIKLYSLLLTIAVSSCQLSGNSETTMDNTNKEETAAPVKDTSDAQQSLPFPLKTGFSDAYLKATFWKCNYSSAGPEHAYWVILPNFIKPTSVDPETLKEVGLTNIGIYNTIDKTLPYIEVWVAYETVKGEQLPADWLLDKIRITGETVINQNPITYADGMKSIDVLTSKTIDNGEKVISRFTGFNKGKDFYVVKASCNIKDYTQQANTIFHIVSHWGQK